ncbi:MAG: hypothetical protein WCJ30_03930 [Deltaproteobacteria bacterium]
MSTNPRPRSGLFRIGLLLAASALLAGIAECRLDAWLLPQRWSLSDEPLPAWFFSPLGRAWTFGAPLVVLALLAAGLTLIVRGLRR